MRTQSPRASLVICLLRCHSLLSYARLPVADKEPCQNRESEDRLSGANKDGAPEFYLQDGELDRVAPQDILQRPDDILSRLKEVL